MKSTIKSLFLAAALLSGAAAMSGETLYVGTNYHPHDDPRPEKIAADIALMKDAGFNVVRMGHLAWDSYEPREGEMDFEWFDAVMDSMAAAGIKVILDIAVRPAPLWLHARYPSINVTDREGSNLYPNHRYMEDVGDPHFQDYALRFTDAMSRRYASHPALLAFGIDNEPGDGPISYSPEVRARFIDWLRDRYATVDSLNKAWAGQRWSRRIGDFSEVGLPASGAIDGAPERVLDFRRFVSDELNGFYAKMVETVNRNAPGVLTNTNAWYYSPLKYFDYAPQVYSGMMTRNGCGFYPGGSLTTPWGVMNALFGISRIQFESDNPFWCSEFTTMTATPGSIRRSAYATLMYGNTMVCGWTWQSMHGGEEQYLQGMLDWDGTPNRKLDEYRRIAREFKKIEGYFPYRNRAKVALAYAFDSQMASQSLPETHERQVQSAWDPFFHRNIDVRIIDPRLSPMVDYNVIIVPGMTLVDEVIADKLRRYVADGGTLVMTAGSALVDITGKLPVDGNPVYLQDLFGVRMGGFEESAALNELSRTGASGNEVVLDWGDGVAMKLESERVDLIYPATAEVVAKFTGFDCDYPAVTVNTYGKGRAVYVAMPVRGDVVNRLLDRFIADGLVDAGPEVPSGVMARYIDENHLLLLNNTGEAKRIPLPRRGKSLLTDASFHDHLDLAPYEPEFIELQR